LFTVIRGGVAGSIMPPSAATDAEIWAIVAHLRSISTVPPLASNGDAAQGRALFAERCGECHRSSSSDGGLGPDLRQIAQLRSRETLVQSIRYPSSVVAEGYRTVTLRTSSDDRPLLHLACCSDEGVQHPILEQISGEFTQARACPVV
jgi:hypothetical protein